MFLEKVNLGCLSCTVHVLASFTRSLQEKVDSVLLHRIIPSTAQNPADKGNAPRKIMSTVFSINQCHQGRHLEVEQDQLTSSWLVLLLMVEATVLFWND